MQDLALQLDALKAAGCETVFEDHASGAKADRPGLTKALAHLRRGETLVVWKLDRLGRSMAHLIETVRGLEGRGVGFRSLTEGVDTTTPGGTLIFHVFGALAQFERDLIRERTRAGLKAAEARGRKGGRRPAVTPDKLARARVLTASGLTVREAARRLKVGKTALYKALNDLPGITVGVSSCSTLAYTALTFVQRPQVCVSPTRFYVHEKHRCGFADAFVGATKAMRIGSGLDPATEIGPLVSKPRLEAVAAMVQETVDGGARIVHGGGRPAGLERGYFFEPTVFADTPDGARAMVDEPFGPLAPLASFEDFDEVIRRANSLQHGLAAYVFTNSLKRAHKTIDALKTGIVCVNNLAAAMPEMPFGGVKHSGFGREGGSQGILDYLDVKFANIVM